ncbi:CIC11C00000005453 [Sungouiella intermedia]|uniref:CIC11C00000001707 n=1 Tax=Sungouiella intermedia TaxID=45354 RepID=A0A1L0DI10_9ASCO|nr:CIC11C00000001707 [[Candida] intermedia]SGZ55576.1 CIC11C00000005453 [[Candida] intermedia]
MSSALFGSIDPSTRYLLNEDPKSPSGFLDHFSSLTLESKGSVARDHGKQHGSLARAGKVKSQTPKVDKTEKPKKPQGRAYKRLLYTRRFVNVTLVNGKRKANSNAA